MNEIKVKKINPIEDSIDEYEFIKNSMDNIFTDVTISDEKIIDAIGLKPTYEREKIIFKYKNIRTHESAIILFLLLFSLFFLYIKNIAFMFLILSMFSYIYYLFTPLRNVKRNIMNKIKNNHMELFYPLKNDEIISIIKNNYSKREKIFHKMRYKIINKFEINKIIGEGNPKFINDNIELIEGALHVLSRYSYYNILKYDKIIENQKKAIDIVESPDFLKNNYFNVEYGVENGPQLQEYLEGDKKDIIDYINDKCLKEYNRKSSFIKITS